MDEKEKRKTVEGRASELDFTQLYFFTVTYETHGNMTLFAGNKPFARFIHKSTRRKGLTQEINEAGGSI